VNTSEFNEFMMLRGSLKVYSGLGQEFELSARIPSNRKGAVLVNGTKKENSNTNI
jgi:hypothetical protein